ncbi:MAG: aldose 1-epimerase [Pirellulaceae bacterium]
MPGVITLASPDGTATARIQTDLGFNLFHWQVAGTQNLLWSHADFGDGQQRPSGSGIPILFPFPGRIAGGQFAWDGLTYRVNSDDGRGNAIHGFVFNRPWKAEQTAEESVRGVFRASEVDLSILDQWPADFEITTEYTLGNNQLVSKFTMRSFERPLPCGLGLHPYFRFDLQTDSPAVTMKVPVSQRWPLDNMNPTGTIESVGTQLSAGTVVNQLELDDVYSTNEIASDADPHEASLGTADLGVSIRFDADFSQCVVYTPPHREAICIEPYTCVPNAIAQVGSEEQNRFGLRVLPADSQWSVKVTYEAAIKARNASE